MAPITVRLLKKTAPPAAVHSASPYLGQKYQELRQQCLQKGALFEDPLFPASPASVGYSELGPRSEKARGITWKRPQEISQVLQFISQDMSRTDVCQGILGNCWFLAAAASLSLYPQLMHRVVPPDQSFQEGYAGIFHFQFWQYGQWVDVVIDDRLPVKDGQLVFLRSPEKEEFWAALLEKASAKLNGSYEALDGGSINEAFVDFTGGIGERINLKAPPADLFKLVERAVKMKSLMGASLEIKNKWESEAHTPEGLVKGHAYSVTGVKQVEVNGRKVQLARLRNPWGKVEWTGRWSDNCPQWNLLDPVLRAEMHVRAEDGEFWMRMEDFLRCFDNLELCNLSPDSLGIPKEDGWNNSIFQGRWVRGYNAGGCRNNQATFWTNPQYLVELSEADGDEEPGCTLLVSLTQRDRRQEKRRGQELLAIGFEIFQIPPQVEYIIASWRRRHNSSAAVAACKGELAGGTLHALLWVVYGLHTRVDQRLHIIHCSVLLSRLSFSLCLQYKNLMYTFEKRRVFPSLLPVAMSQYITLRDVNLRCRLSPGQYLIIPSTYNAMEEAKFTLQIFTEKKQNIREIDDEIRADEQAFQVTTTIELDEVAWKIFKQFAAQDQQINAPGLQEIMNKLLSQHSMEKVDSFSLESSQQMLALVDVNDNGKLGLGEFKRIWGKIKSWELIFAKHDTNQSRAMESYEIRMALESAGFHLNNRLTEIITKRYGNASMRISFSGFVSCLVLLEATFKKCQVLDKNKDGVLHLTRQEWVELSTFA
ncbi:calpain-1 catalytic subunit-like [Ambystoma mexicanum]|uniref:calpain-1 catalytic subunit-like n=1 Tax=Ambystoma mexicanum TaxID=8296 RepID=UPI0037E82979